MRWMGRTSKMHDSDQKRVVQPPVDQKPLQNLRLVIPIWSAFPIIAAGKLEQGYGKTVHTMS